MLKNTIKKFCFIIVRKIGRIVYRKHAWLVSDRKHFAGDNGEAFFEYLQDKPVNSVFAISKESKDYERMKQMGKVVEYDSVLYKFLLCVCDAHISSQLIHMENHEETPQIFLQHGVTASNISEMLRPVSHKNFYILATGKREEEAFLKSPYQLDASHVWLTGFPRHDKLNTASQKIITISMTWRKYLAGVEAKDFFESEYYKAYQKLVCNERLVKKLASYGYQLYLQLHPEMERFKSMFQVAPGVEIWDAGYTDIFAQSSLLITDYSSISFDFALLEKPVVYYQFDEDTFWQGKHNYTKGYFDYRQDGFGEVINTYEDLEELILDYVKKECKIKEEYLERTRDFFAYQDKMNSERVYQKIVTLLTD